jgi:heptosyltransferase-2
MNVAIFLPNWLGDLVMATPALRALRRRFPPPCRIVGIVRPHLMETLAGTPWLDELWGFQAKSTDPSQRRWALIRRMRRQRFDLAVLLTNSLHTAALAWLGGARQRVGYRRDGRGLLLTHKVEPPHTGRSFAPEPMVRSYQRLAEAAGCPPFEPQLELAVTAAEEELTEQVWQRLGLRHDGRVIVINSSGAYGSAKLWPAEHCAALARRIVDELDHDVLVLCGPSEEDSAREIVRRAQRSRVVSLAGQPIGLGLSKGVIRRSCAMVSTDSGPLHVARALGKPTIALLGPTAPIWIENPTIENAVLQLPLDCSACYQRTCPLGHHRCMQDLTPELVFVALARRLKA